MSCNKKDILWGEIFNEINDAITVHDKDFNIIEANKASSELLGIPIEDILRNKCYNSYHAKSCPPEGCPSCKSLKTGKISVSEIYEPALKKFIEVKAIPRFNESKEIIGIIHIVRDITERKKREEELSDKFHKLEVLYNATKDREKRIIELKEKIRSLEEEIDKS